MSAELDKIQKMKDKLDSVSPTFCLAKWKQVSILLQNGTTHSCAHPAPHKIPLGEIKNDPSALHNTEYKKNQRKKMLHGDRPKECQYCWNIEDSGQHFSDRHIKSSEFWARDNFDQISKINWEANVNPSYLEVSFSSTCQFKCAYCFPQVSSKWMKEVQDFGPYEISKNTKYHDVEYLKSAGLMPIEEEEKNPYIDAFWKWMPTLYPELKMLRITGGEPLLSENTFKVLDWVDQNPRNDLGLAINSNLGISDAILDRFSKRVSNFVEMKKVSSLDIFTSVDTSGAHAEYIRSGLVYSKWLLNVRKVFDTIPKVKVGVMCTYNALSVHGFRGLLKDILEIRTEYPSEKMWRLWLDIGYVRYPAWQSVQILTSEHHKIMEEDLEFMKAHRADYFKGQIGFYDVEIEKMSRLISWAKHGLDEKTLASYRNNFKLFFTEQDRRRGTNIKATFSDMEEFFSQY